MSKSEPNNDDPSLIGEEEYGCDICGTTDREVLIYTKYGTVCSGCRFGGYDTEEPEGDEPNTPSVRQIYDRLVNHMVAETNDLCHNLVNLNRMMVVDDEYGHSSGQVKIDVGGGDSWGQNKVLDKIDESEHTISDVHFNSQNIYVEHPSVSVVDELKRIFDPQLDDDEQYREYQVHDDVANAEYVIETDNDHTVKIPDGVY